MSKLFRIFVAPTKVFKELKENPKVALAFWMLIIFMMIYMAVFRTVAPYETRMQAVFEKQELKGTEIPDDVKKEILEKGESIYVVIISYLALPLATVIIFFVIALLVQFFSYFVSGKSVTVKESFAISIYGGFPAIITSLAIIIAMMLIFPEKVDPIRPDRSFVANLSILVNRNTHQYLSDILASFDLFSIWRTILIVIGVNVMSDIDKMKRNRPILLGISIFMIFAVMQFVFSLITG